MKQEKRKLSLGKLTITNLGLSAQGKVKGGDPQWEPTIIDNTCTNCTCQNTCTNCTCQTDHPCWH